jgi:hypothetical protein
MRGPFEILTTGEVHQPVVIPRGTPVDLAAMNRHPRIACGGFLADRGCPICGTVVGQEKLEVLIVLIKDRIDGCREVGLPVVDGETYRDAGNSHLLPDPSGV